MRGEDIPIPQGLRNTQLLTALSVWWQHKLDLERLVDEVKRIEGGTPNYRQQLERLVEDLDRAKGRIK